MNDFNPRNVDPRLLTRAAEYLQTKPNELTAGNPRLNPERDLKVAYALGRLGLATVGDLWPLFWTSASTARFGFGRLTGLGLIRSFERSSPSEPKWYSLSPEGVDWVVEEAGCAVEELRAFSGIARVNLPTLTVRNRLWVSLALASARSPAAPDRAHSIATSRCTGSPPASAPSAVSASISASVGW